MFKQGHFIIGGILFSSLLLLAPATTYGQEQDTTRINIENNRDSSNIENFNTQLDRSMSGGTLTSMGTHGVPRENQYYQRPFMGQKHLDRAVEAYRKELGKQVGDGWFWQFLKLTSNFVKLELGAFETLQMEYVDRDHPLWRSYTNDDKLK